MLPPATTPPSPTSGPLEREWDRSQAMFPPCLECAMRRVSRDLGDTSDKSTYQYPPEEVPEVPQGSRPSALLVLSPLYLTKLSLQYPQTCMLPWST